MITKQEAINLLSKCKINVNSLPEYLKDDKDVALIAVKHIRYSYPYLSKRLQEDKDVFCERVKSFREDSVYIFSKLESDWKYDKDIINYMLDLDYNIYKHLKEDLRSDIEIMNKYLKKYPENYKYVNEKLKEDKELLLKNIAKHGDSFGYSINKFKNNKEVALYAIDYCDDVFLFIDDKELLNDDDLISKQLSLKQTLKNISPNKLSDKEFMLKALSQNGLDYQSLLDNELSKDYDIIITSIRNGNRNILYFLPKEVIDDTNTLTKILELMYSKNYIENGEVTSEYKSQMIKIFENSEYRFNFNNVNANKQLTLENYIKIKSDALDLVFPIMLNKLMKSEIIKSNEKSQIVKF